MNILIVSIDHQVQLDHGELASTTLKQRRDRLEALLQKEITERNVGFVSEEADPRSKRLTVAQRLASTHNPPIPWRNIDMTEEERITAGINKALKNRPFHPESRGEETFTIDHRIPEDDSREEFMVSKAIEFAGMADSILVLCGDMHTRALKQKFEKRGHSADTDESLITYKNWADAAAIPKWPIE